MKIIDLRSDTVTTPTKEMLENIFSCSMGDDVFEDDETIKNLEKKIALMLGKENALFVPSGTFSNQLALFTHCERGEEVIVDQFSHIRVHESGASAIIAGVQLLTLESNQGYWNLDKLRNIICPGNIFSAKTKLICLENAYNGYVLSIEYMKEIYEIAKEQHVNIHLDGARFFNACTALNIEAKQMAQYADTISICLSKGLCAPIGSLLVGNDEFIEKARLKRKIMGGGMRQSGILGACGLVALDKMTIRLKIDHDHAKYMASLLKEIKNVIVDEKQLMINMVFFDVLDNRKYELEKYLKTFNIKILPYENGFRFVTHYYIDQEMIDFVVQKIKEYFV